MLNRKGLFIVIVAFFSAFLGLSQKSEAQASKTSPFDSWFPEAPEMRRLPNGLSVLMVRWPSPGIVAYYTLVRVGSRDEVEAGHTGFAHFFEHMMFRGSERFPQAAYDAALEGVGADHNAFTTQDFTCYTIVGPSSALPLFVELESDRFQRLSYSEEVFKTEAGAVRGEYQVWSSKPEQPMWEALSQLAFQRHTYGHTTIGYLRDIELMPTRYNYSLRFFKRFYTPDATTIIVVGDFEKDELFHLIQEHYGSWRGKRDNPPIPKEPPPKGGRKDLEWSRSTPPRMMIGYRVPAFLPDRPSPSSKRQSLREAAALDVIHTLVFHRSSPLYRRLVIEEKKLLELSSWAGEHSKDPGLFVIEATLRPPDGSASPSLFDPIIDAIQEEFDRIANNQIPAQRITQVKEHLLYATPMQLETPSSVAYLLASMLALSESIEDIRDFYRYLSEITPAEVAECARRHLVPSHRYVVTLRGPKEGEPK